MHSQVEAAVGAESGQHVVEERQTGRNIGLAGAIEIHRADDARFAGGALDTANALSALCLQMVLITGVHKSDFSL